MRGGIEKIRALRLRFPEGWNNTDSQYKERARRARTSNGKWSAMAMMVPYGRLNALNDWFNMVNDLVSTDPSTRAESFPASFMMDVQENADGYVVEATLPGVSRDEIDVELNEGHLNISVDKKDSEEVAKRNYIHRETSSYRAVRSVYLKDADTAGLTASLKDGVLTVNVPKRTQNSNVTKIQIG